MVAMNENTLICNRDSPDAFIQLFEAKISHSSRIKKYRRILYRYLRSIGAVFHRICLEYDRDSRNLVLGTYVPHDCPNFDDNLKLLQLAAEVLSLVSEEQPPVVNILNRANYIRKVESP